MTNLLLIGLIVLCARCCMTISRTITFSNDFKFGSATSSYQIEGGWNVDGKGPSIWDTYTHDHPEAINDGSNGDVAANSYEYYKKDVAALKSIGAQFYRFSISWPRVLSTGDISSRNQVGLDYYHKLIDELIDNDIVPIVTMFHWDLPQPIQDLGGFTNTLIVEYFEQYANLLFQEYGSKVKTWITLNEPMMFCQKGYSEGNWAPGLKLRGVGDYYCAHNSILTHARVYNLYKEKYFEAQKGRVGLCLNTRFMHPEDPSNVNDVEASEQALQFNIGVYANPIFTKTGDYPQVVRKNVDKNSAAQGYAWSRLPKFTTEQLDYVKGSSDFLGLNYYTGSLVRQADVNHNFSIPSIQHDMWVYERQDINWPKGKLSWAYSNPFGLYKLLKWIRDRYQNIEVIITENGWSDNGEINDVGRVDFLKGHLAAVSDAVAEGCNVTGYTTWSLIDNFEWASGYTAKFGIFKVDGIQNNFTRVEKLSAGVFRNIITNRQFDIDDIYNIVE